MKFTEQWLRRHLDYDCQLSVVCEKLGMIGFEVERVVDESSRFENFVVATVVNVHAHPNATKLSVCDVFDGTRMLQIVCGAKNIRAGLKVILALVGALIPSNGVTIQKATIRGVESEGMLCSEGELELPDFCKKYVVNSGENGIIELLVDSTVGLKFVELCCMNDFVVDVSITPNRRQDGASVYGIARDLCAAGIGTLNVNAREVSRTSTDDVFLHCNKLVKTAPIKVRIEEAGLCASFRLHTVHDVSSEYAINLDSYHEMERVLELTGHKHENVLVNISNFFMFDTGHPNHIYDADKICGEVKVRKSISNEKFTPIGMHEICLPAGVLVVADEEKIIAIAGVIGGESSKVTDSTKTVAIELANFAPEAVVHSTRITGIHTDSSFRFEGRVDHGAEDELASALVGNVLKCCGGSVGPATLVHGKGFAYCERIDCDPSLLRTFANSDISSDEGIEILGRLGFVVECKRDGRWAVTVPSWKHGGVTTQYGVIEEIIRIAGMHRVKSDVCIVPSIKKLAKLVDINRGRHSVIVETMIMRGMDEVTNWSFISRKLSDVWKLGNAIEIDNPITQDFGVMRTTILPGLLQVIMKNSVRGIRDFCIFESGYVYGNEFQLRQRSCIAGMRTGWVNVHNIHKDNRSWDFYDVRDDMLCALRNIGVGINDIDIKPVAAGYYHPNRCATIVLDGVEVGYCGELHPELKIDKKYVPTQIYAFELFEDYVFNTKSKVVKTAFRASQYQMVERDLACLIAYDVAAMDVCKLISGLGIELIRDVRLFDVYSDPAFGRDKKSVAVRITMQSFTKTLTEVDVNDVMSNVVDAVKLRFGAIMRDK